MENELYVKAWFLLVVAGMLIATATGTIIYYGESQHTQSLLNGIADDFTEQLSTLQTNHSQAISQLATDFATINVNTTALLADKVAEIANLETQITELQATIASQVVTYNELDALYNIIFDERSALSLQLNNTIILLQEKSQELNRTKMQLQNKSQELNETLALYDSYHLHDVNLENVTTFIAEDLTNEHLWSNGTYTAVNYAFDVDVNATNLGIRCGVMHFYTSWNGTDWVVFLNVFNTIDYDLVFVDIDDTFYYSISEIETIYGVNDRYITTW